MNIRDITMLPYHLHQILKAYKREIFVIAFFSAVVNILMLSPTLYMLQVFDRVLISRSELTLYVLTILVLFFYLTQALAEWLRSRLTIAISLRIDQTLGENVFNATFENQLAQERQNPLQSFSDLNLIRQWLTGQSVYAFFDLPWSLVYLSVMFLLHPLLGWLTIFFMLLLGAFSWWSSRQGTNAILDTEKEEKEHNRFVYTKLKNAEVIEAHGMAVNLRQRWQDYQDKALMAMSKSSDVEERFSVTGKEIRVLMQSLALACGAMLAINSEISVGSMIAAALLVGRATSPIDQIASGWKMFGRVVNATKRINALVNASKESKAEDIEQFSSITLRCENISVLIPSQNITVLDIPSAQFAPGNVYAVVGPSGAGKSTFGRVLMGINPSINGDVYVNNISYAAISRESLGKQLGYLPQNIELFSGTVAENIARMGVPNSENVIAAAQLTDTHELILKMPKGYDTQIGEAGAYLSGGQRQRIALARALYGNPKLIVLDEPNSNLDSAGQAALSTAIQKLKEAGSTVFLITHQHMLLSSVDIVILMRHGRIEMIGPREDVQAKLAQGREIVSRPVPSTLNALPNVGS